MVGHEGQIILNYLQRWGNPTSLALLNPLCKIFYKPELDGILGYRDSSHCAVVFGDPICAQEIMPALIRDFHQDCFEKNKKIIYASVSESYMRWAIDNVCELAIEIGKEVIINPLFDLTAHKQDNMLIYYARKKMMLNEIM